ncbi:YlmC/YmxH family sporulation protein [Clostridium chromiireducens]|uniref:PRC-barrel domain protein n=1 Tax=Clostridium chromiireducens TaxID=225345 RepID=A0A1V4IPU2_9CLOT|nr:YlmC/YmxH family sporulation protein [Clostridium chromiireducens]OPJ61840.1 PRC-barrel domain protein [Clostridium chromiireducens]RII35070.1 YlmC/YmxH family sporulation protein [Clostridium chromiireducens]
MELELHSLNAMRNMEVIDILTGTKIGFIKDFKISSEDNKIVALILPGEIKSWFAKDDEKEILWKDIVKIGTDVILVKANEKVSENNI